MRIRIVRRAVDGDNLNVRVAETILKRSGVNEQWQRFRHAASSSGSK
jgi:hypothetical protein